ncbi:MAG: histidine phosphatase family protein [Chloroflexi bacterium]|nr:histidine phosphatase family protein [Chloroflexota bacterium]
MRLVLVRHGETSLNRDGRVQGQRDNASLDDLGRRQSAALAMVMAREEVGVLYSSPLARSMETAQMVAQACGVGVTPLEALMEADVGELEGLTSAQMRERYPGFMERWRADAATAVMPEGESLTEVQERASKAVAALSDRHHGETVVAVSHHFTICSLLCWALGMPLTSFRHFRVDLASKTVLEFRQRGQVLVRLNDRCHLESL